MPDHDYAQRTLLRMLLDAHPAMLRMDDVRARLSEVPRLDEASRVLIGDGLATRVGDLIGVTRAAVRAEQLTA